MSVSQSSSFCKIGHKNVKSSKTCYQKNPFFELKKTEEELIKKLERVKLWKTQFLSPMKSTVSQQSHSLKIFSLENRFLPKSESAHWRGPGLTPKREKSSRKGKNIKMGAFFCCIIFTSGKTRSKKNFQKFPKILIDNRSLAAHDHAKRDEKGVNSWGEKEPKINVAQSSSKFSASIFTLEKNSPFCT